MIDKTGPEFTNYNVDRLDYFYGTCGTCHREFDPMFNNQFFCHGCRSGFIVGWDNYAVLKGAV